MTPKNKEIEDRYAGLDEHHIKSLKLLDELLNDPARKEEVDEIFRKADEIDCPGPTVEEYFEFLEKTMAIKV